MKNHRDIVSRYKRMRSVSLRMNKELIEFCSPAVKQAAKDLGVWSKGSIIMDMDEMPVLMDHTIHHRFKGKPSGASRYIAEHPAEPGSDAEAVQAAMAKAYFSLFQIKDAVKGVGVHVLDILRDEEHLLADVGLSKSSARHMVLATRVLPFEGFIMTTGAALPVDIEVLERVVDNIEQSDLTHEDLRNLPPKAWAEIERSVIHDCLRSDGKQQITYEDIPADSPKPLAKASQRVGRNAPCPCGSGKKHKKCCGR